MLMCRIIPTGFIPGFLTHDNNLTNEKNLMKFNQISYSGLLIIMGQKTVVWELRYDPTQQQEIVHSFHNLVGIGLNIFLVLDR